MEYLVVACRFVVGATFFVAALGKLRSAATRNAMAALVTDVTGLSRPGPVVAAVLCAEAAVVALVAVPLTVFTGLALATVLLVAFTVAIGVALRRGVRTPCGCFGTSQAPLGVPHVARNTLLLLVTEAGTVGWLAGAGGTGGGWHPLGLAVSLCAAAVVTVLFVFFDDIAALFTEPATQPAHSPVRSSAPRPPVAQR